MRKQSVHVFIVEDHPATARGLKVFLELAGYAATVAQDLRSALALAAQTPFDVLVCDLNLPDGTGWELMEKLRAKSPVRGIVFSAFDDPELVARSKAVGFAEHVVKGTTPETLLAAVDRLARAAAEDARVARARPQKRLSTTRKPTPSRKNRPATAKVRF